MNLGFEPTSFNLVASCIRPTHSLCHVMIRHHIVHCIDCVSSLFVGACPPLVDVFSNDENVDTDEDTMLSSEVSGKQPFIIPIQPMFLLLLLFTALIHRDSNCCVLR